MDKERIMEILKNKEINDIFYDERPIWIQELHDTTATIGFLDGAEAKDVFIEDLYEGDLYRDEN